MRDEDKFSKDSMITEKGRVMYVYIKIDNVDDFYEKSLKLVITPVTRPKDWPWGNREFIVKGSDGHKLCFVQLKGKNILKSTLLFCHNFGRNLGK